MVINNRKTPNLLQFEDYKQRKALLSIYILDIKKKKKKTSLSDSDYFELTLILVTKLKKRSLLIEKVYHDNPEVH